MILLLETYLEAQRGKAGLRKDPEPSYARGIYGCEDSRRQISGRVFRALEREIPMGVELK